jgi:hypothetical protein
MDDDDNDDDDVVRNPSFGYEVLALALSTVHHLGTTETRTSH